MQYQTMRALGEADTPADQPTDAFTSSLQYGGVVYGKAPGLYGALGELLGADAVLAGLRAFVTANAFGVAGSDDLRAALSSTAPDRAAEVDALWQRWIEEAHGDEDIGPGAVPGLDPEQLERGRRRARAALRRHRRALSPPLGCRARARNRARQAGAGHGARSGGSRLSGLRWQYALFAPFPPGVVTHTDANNRW